MDDYLKFINDVSDLNDKLEDLYGEFYALIVSRMKEFTNEYAEEMIFEVSENKGAKEIFGPEIQQVSETAQDLFACFTKLEMLVCDEKAKLKKNV